MVRKYTGEIGFVLLILGVGCVDSPSILLPATMISVGAALIAVAGLDEEWTEK